MNIRFKNTIQNAKITLKLKLRKYIKHQGLQYTDTRKLLEELKDCNIDQRINAVDIENKWRHIKTFVVEVG